MCIWSVVVTQLINGISLITTQSNPFMCLKPEACNTELHISRFESWSAEKKKKEKSIFKKISVSCQDDEMILFA